MLRFLDFPCSLKYCIAIFTFQEDIFTDRLWERSTFSSPFWGFWGFLRSFLWIHVLHPFCSPWEGILKIVCLVLILQSQAGCSQPPIRSPLGGLNAKVCFSPSPAKLSQLFPRAPELSAKACTHCLQGAHTESALEWGLCGGGTWILVGAPGPVGGWSSGKVSPVACVWLLDGVYKEIIAESVSLWCLSRALTAVLLAFSPPSLVSASVLDRVRKRWASLAASCMARAARLSLICSHFSLWEKSRAKKVSLGSELCHLGGGMIWIKWNCSSYSLWVQSHFFFLFSFFAPTMCWKFFAGFLAFHRGTLAHGWLSKLVFFGEETVEHSFSAILLMLLIHTYFFQTRKYFLHDETQLIERKSWKEF